MINEDNKAFVGNFTNSVQLSGLISSKPLIKKTTHPNGFVSTTMTFVVVQHFIGFGGKPYEKRYICATRSQKVIKELTQYENQVYVSLLGKLDYVWDTKENKPLTYPLIEEMAVEKVCADKMREYGK